MKKLNNIMSSHGSYQQLRESEQSAKRPELDSSSHIWELWSILTEYYGAAFTSQYGDEPNATWAYTLRDLTDTDYRNGIELLKNRESAFPPNPGEFIQMIGKDGAWERRAHKVIDPATLITKQRSVEETQIGKATMEALKGMFQWP